MSSVIPPYPVRYTDNSTNNVTFAADSFSVGTVSLAQYKFGVGTTATGGDATMEFADGLLALSSSTIYPGAHNSFWQALMPTLEQAVFTVDLANASAGVLEFGQIDQTKYYGTLQYTPVVPSPGHWGFTLASVSAGGKTLSNGAVTAILGESPVTVSQSPC